MSEDEKGLMEELGEVARQEAARREAEAEARWAALTAGTLSAAEEEALRTAAASSSQGRRALEAYHPLDADFQARLVERLKSELPHATAPTPAPPVPHVVPFSRPAAHWRWPLAALAAGILLVLAWPRREFDPLPAFGLSLEGGRAVSRAATTTPATEPSEEEVPRLANGGRLVLLLRPATAIREPLAARTFLGTGTALRPLAAEPTISATGSVRVELTVGRELPDTAGRQQLAVLVGRRGKLPDTATLRALPTTAPPRQGENDWVLLRTAVEIEEDL